MEDAEAQQQKSAWRTVMIIALAMVTVLSLGVWMFDSIGASALAKAMREARALGGPVTLQELLDARTIPNDSNGANVVLAIRPALEELKKDLDRKDSELKCRLPILGSGEEPPLGHRWSIQTMAEVNSFLTRMKPELDALEELRDCEGGQFPLTIPDNPMSIDLSHLYAARMSVRLKAMQAINDAMQGKTRGLASRLLIMLRAGRLVADDPLMVSPLVSLACEATSATTIERVLWVAAVDTTELAGIQEVLAGRDPYPQMIHAIRGERAMFIGVADWLRRTGSTTGLENSGLPGAIRMPGVHGELMREEARGIELYYRLLRRTDALGLIEEYQVLESELATNKPLKLLDAAFGTMTRPMQLHVRTAAEVHCAEVALAAERFRIDNARWPRDLGELVPGYIDRIPEDPFDPGRPLKKVYREGRLVVYSVGLDNQDDGGDVRRDRADDSQADVGFILLDPVLRNLPALPESQPASSTSPALKADWTGSRVLRGSLLFV